MIVAAFGHLSHEVCESATWEAALKKPMTSNPCGEDARSDSVRGFKMRPDPRLNGFLGAMFRNLQAWVIAFNIYIHTYIYTILDIIYITLCVVCRLVASENLKVQRLSSFHHVPFAQGTEHRREQRLAAAKHGLICSGPQSARLLPAETCTQGPGFGRVTVASLQLSA